MELHRAKDAISPFSVPADTQERIDRLAAFDDACAAITEYERKAGIL